jgi:hypothetical protein
MKRMFALVLVGLFACGSAYAADTKTDATKTDAMKTDAKKTDAMNPQQNKMTACNEKAADKKGDERKAFMKTCLSAKPAKPESKMAMCNKKTAGMKADERAKAQSECMKG